MLVLVYVLVRGCSKAPGARIGAMKVSPAPAEDTHNDHTGPEHTESKHATRQTTLGLAPAADGSSSTPKKGTDGKKIQSIRFQVDDASKKHDVEVGGEDLSPISPLPAVPAEHRNSSRRSFTTLASCE